MPKIKNNFYKEEDYLKEDNLDESENSETNDLEELYEDI